MTDIVSVSVSLPASKLGMLYASLASIMGAAAAPALAAASTPTPSPVSTDQGAAPSADAATAPVAEGGDQAGKKDAAGTLFDPARHTGSIVKSGLWRMKAGMARGPGEGEDSPTYVNPNAAPSVTGSAGSPSPAPSDAPATSAPVADEDEFAAFRAAAGQTAAAPARNWTDADLSKLCNQAALAAGDPAKVKEVIARYVPAGSTGHSREIPADQREPFAQDVERTFSLQYAG